MAGRFTVAALFWYGAVVDMAGNWPGLIEGLVARGVAAPQLVGAGLLLVEVAAPLPLVMPGRDRLSMVTLGAYCVLTAVVFQGFWTLSPDAQLDASFRFFKTVALAGALMMTDAAPQAGEATR